MPAILYFVDAADRLPQPEPGMPCFLDGSAADGDDLNDWWLDLGAVALAGPVGV
jgi:hypothetical protein